ncbi:GAF domain-containing protein [Chloroflexi bacterium TSY]|nr:GAF domain-containing protein [Chloroflexi bacterium TSY]
MLDYKAETLPPMRAAHFDGRSQDRPDWSVNVPAEKLIALMHASNEMMQSSFRRDRRATLKTVARYVYDLLNVEASAVFLVSSDPSGDLLLEASVTDVWGDTFETEQLKISRASNRDMTSFIAAFGKIVRLHGADLKNHPNNTSNSEPLLSGMSHSFLGIPLKNRKEQLLGMITASNKKSSEGVPTETEFFDEVDESIARILASEVAVVLENLRIFETLTNLLHQIHTERDLEQILDTILTEGITLLNGERGEIVLWDESKQDLIVAAQSGESNTPQLGEPATSPSIVRTLWKSHDQSIFIPDVAVAPNYHASTPQTKCEISVRLKTAEREIGIINVESFQPGGLDEQDIEVLELLAKYAAVAYQVVGKERRFRDIVTQLGDSRPPKEVLTGILESVRDIYGLGSGIIYIADDAKRILRCSALVNEEKIEIEHPEKFSYRYDESAFATQVLHTKSGYFSPEPPMDSAVNPQGLNAFKIRSSMVGVPLLFENQVVGVLVGWSNFTFW